MRLALVSNRVLTSCLQFQRLHWIRPSALMTLGLGPSSPPSNVIIILAGCTVLGVTFLRHGVL